MCPLLGVSAQGGSTVVGPSCGGGPILCRHSPEWVILEFCICGEWSPGSSVGKMF